MLRSFKRVVGKEWIAGVCAGLAYWIGMPTWLVRLIFFIFIGKLLLLYLILWIFMPEWEKTPDDYEKITDDN